MADQKRSPLVPALLVCHGLGMTAFGVSAGTLVWFLALFFVWAAFSDRSAGVPVLTRMVVA